MHSLLKLIALGRANSSGGNPLSRDLATQLGRTVPLLWLSPGLPDKVRQGRGGEINQE